MVINRGDQAGRGDDCRRLVGCGCQLLLAGLCWLRCRERTPNYRPAKIPTLRKLPPDADDADAKDADAKDAVSRTSWTGACSMSTALITTPSKRALRRRRRQCRHVVVVEGDKSAARYR
jgi:hypothetical protein